VSRYSVDGKAVAEQGQAEEASKAMIAILEQGYRTGKCGNKRSILISTTRSRERRQVSYLLRH
jgi:hypothetical protein